MRDGTVAHPVAERDGGVGDGGGGGAEARERGGVAQTLGERVALLDVEAAQDERNEDLRDRRVEATAVAAAAVAAAGDDGDEGGDRRADDLEADDLDYLLKKMDGLPIDPIDGG